MSYADDEVSRADRISVIAICDTDVSIGTSLEHRFGSLQVRIGPSYPFILAPWNGSPNATTAYEFDERWT